MGMMATLTVIFMLAAGPIALATNGDESKEIGQQNQEESEFIYEVPEDIQAGVPVDVEVTFTAAKDYEGVRFRFGTNPPEGLEGEARVVFSAEDTEGAVHEFTNTGYWGPSEGFDMDEDYSETTTWTLTFSHAGEYTIWFQLYDVEAYQNTENEDDLSDAVLTTGKEDIEVDVPDHSTYRFLFDVPSVIVPEEEVKVDVSLVTEQLGDSGYEAVLFGFEVTEREGDVTFWATDSEGTEHEFTNEGSWGPPGGFPLPAEYDETTAWTLEFSEAGEYTIEFYLFEVDDEETRIAEASATVSVLDEIATDASLHIAPRALNLRSGGHWIAAIIRLPVEYLEGVDESSVQLEGIGADRVQVGGRQIVATFSRPEIAELLEDGEATLEATVLANGTLFTATDTIRVIDPGRILDRVGPPHRDDSDSEDGSHPGRGPDGAGPPGLRPR